MTPAPHAIAGSVRANRERLGWSRETLAHHAGISWAAITQIESGRRTDVRLSTLSALARALGISVDHLIGAAAAGPPAMLEHHALVYASDAELVERMAPFIAHGVERGEAVLTVTTPARIRRLRNALHGSARDAEFVSCRDWYSSPVEALRRYRGFIEERLATGAPWIRIVGEPVWDGCSAAEIETWKRYESMINISLATTPATIVCPYDAGALPAAIVRGAQRTHPSLSGSDGPVACPDYEDPEALLLGRSRR